MTLLTIRELKIQSGSQPMTATIRAQLDSIHSKSAKSGNEFLELRLADAEDGFVLRIWSDAAGFAAARRLLGRTFIEAAGEWTQNQYGLDARNLTLRQLADDEAAEILGGPSSLRERQAVDWAFIGATCGTLSDPRLRFLTQRFLDEYRRALSPHGCRAENTIMRAGAVSSNTSRR